MRSALHVALSRALPLRVAFPYTVLLPVALPRVLPLRVAFLYTVLLPVALPRDYFFLVATHPRAPVQVSGVPS